jgi:CDP-diacylglycerol--glycerol-3-phosphate 3-phosphatidyltransferase
MFGVLRKKEQSFMKSFGKFFSRFFTANQMTFISFLSGFLAIYTYGVLRNPFLGVLSIILIGFTDMLDGAIARVKGTTRFGKAFDPLVDRYAEFFIIVGIYLGGFSTGLWVLLCLSGMFLASYIRARSESVVGPWKKTVGIAERQEKLLLIIIGSLLYYYDPIFVHYAIILCAILSHITVLQRTLYARKL